MSVLSSMFKDNARLILLVYGMVVLCAVMAGITPIMIASAVESLPVTPTVLMGFLVMTYWLHNVSQYAADYVRTTLRQTVWVSHMKEEVRKGIPTSELVVKLRIGNAIPDILVCDVPSVIEVIVGLSVLVASLIPLGMVYVGIAILAILVSTLITLWSTRRLNALHLCLYDASAEEITALSSVDVSKIAEWKQSEVDITNRFWKVDLAQGALQVPVIVGALCVSLSIADLDVVTFTLIVGVYMGIFSKVDHFAKLQESLGRAWIAIGKLYD